MCLVRLWLEPPLTVTLTRVDTAITRSHESRIVKQLSCNRQRRASHKLACYVTIIDNICKIQRNWSSLKYRLPAATPHQSIIKDSRAATRKVQTKMWKLFAAARTWSYSSQLRHVTYTARVNSWRLLHYCIRVWRHKSIKSDAGSPGCKTQVQLCYGTHGYNGRLAVQFATLDKSLFAVINHSTGWLSGSRGGVAPLA